MTEDEPISALIASRQAQFVEDFTNYGHLLNSMSAAEIAVEIGRTFHDPKQAAIIAVMMGRIIALERK